VQDVRVRPCMKQAVDKFSDHEGLVSEFARVYQSKERLRNHVRIK